MRFWIRELAGWLLVAIGLFIFYTCYTLLVKDDPRRDQPRLFEAGLLTPIAFIIFRGGIHLLKVAVAARICVQTQERLNSQRSGPGSGRRATTGNAGSPTRQPTPERR